MCTTGYCFFDQREAERMAEPVPGPTTDRFAQIAREHHCYIVFGMPERDEQTGLLYNTAAFVGPDGFIGKHRKTHAYIAEPKWAAPGNLGHQVFDTEIGRIAVLICMDIHFVETARLAAVAERGDLSSEQLVGRTHPSAVLDFASLRKWLLRHRKQSVGGLGAGGRAVQWRELRHRT